MMNRETAIDIVLGWAYIADLDAAENENEGWTTSEVNEVLESLGVPAAEIHDVRERAE